MNGKVKSAATMGLAIIALFALLIPRLLQEARQSQILETTVKMMMYKPQSAGQGAGYIVSDGLGTLVHQNGQAIIVTHDHWSLLDQSPEGVQFFDASGNFLLTVSGSEFDALIHYRDGGTMVITPPEVILNALAPASFLDSLLVASLGETGAVQQGDGVILTTHDPNSGNVSLVEANVELIAEKAGRPVFRLQNQDGEQIIPGDSGGGVWFQGQLVGNLWTTIMLEQVADANGAEVGDGAQTRRPTTFSLAAMLPAIG